MEVDPFPPERCLAPALHLLAHGFHPIPIHIAIIDGSRYKCTCGDPSGECKGKHPAGRWRQFQTQQPTIDEVNAWFTGRWRYYNVGAVHGRTARTIALDWDGDIGLYETLPELTHTLGPLPATPTVLSGGGGMHNVFRYPAHVTYVQTVKNLRPGLDVRGDGGITVMPPSTHLSMRDYAWDVDNHIDDLPLAELPEPWVALISGHATSTYSPPQAPPTRDAANMVVDGREDFMRAVVYTTWRRLYREGNGHVDELTLTATAWAEYSAQVDLSRPGRGYTELANKCYSILRNKMMSKPLLEPPTFDC